MCVCVEVGQNMAERFKLSLGSEYDNHIIKYKNIKRHVTTPKQISIPVASV